MPVYLVTVSVSGYQRFRIETDEVEDETDLIAMIEDDQKVKEYLGFDDLLEVQLIEGAKA